MLGANEDKPPEKSAKEEKKKTTFLEGVERKSFCYVFVFGFENICEIWGTEI